MPDTVLPDFSTVKKRVMTRLAKQIEVRVQQRLGPFKNVPRFLQHEGDRFALSGEEVVGGEESFEEFGATLDATPAATGTGSLDGALDRAADEMAAQVTRHAFAQLSKAVEAVGNVVSAAGREFSQDVYLEALEKVDLVFDERGGAILPTLAMHPDMAAKVGPRIVEWEQDPAFQRRLKELIARKREVWRAREARRRLVD